MSPQPPAVVIVGAGSVGVVAGYDLSRAGSQVTFLVRAHRTEQLARPQVLYSYEDNTVQHYSGFDVITDAAELLQRPADIVIVTLDGAALRAEAGVHLTQELGRAYRDTKTGVVLATGGIHIRSWFIEQSGLREDQVAMGLATTLIHEVPAAAMPSDAAVDAALLGSADYAYRRMHSSGFMVDDTAPEVAQTLQRAFSGEGVLPAAIVSDNQITANIAGLTPILAWGLLDWRPLDEFDASDPTWQLAVDAMREIQRLSLFGDTGRSAAEQTEPAAVLESFRQTAEATRPLDYAAFNAYHHGGKVNRQDLDILDEARQEAAAEGAATPALDTLIDRLAAS